MNGVVLDAGAFVALEKGNRHVSAVFARAKQFRLPLITSAGVVGQVWRGTPRQTPIARVLRWENTKVDDFTEPVGRTVGRMLAMAGGGDVVDAHVALLAVESGLPVLTSDPDDLRRLGPTLTLWQV